VGDILEYWGGSPGEGFTTTQMKGFTLEIAGLLVMLFGSVAFGVIYRRANVLPRFMPWLLIAAGPVALSCPHRISLAVPCSCSVVPGWSWATYC
jgi:hypothetical protein